MTRLVILAAGKGTRMNSELPKVLVSLKNRPMIKYLLDAITLAAVDPQPIVVVSPDNQNLISQALAEYSNLQYVVQTQQLGTGHAVASTRELIARTSPEAQNIIVLYGDHPFLTDESIRGLAAIQPEALTLMTTQLPDFTGWRQNFYHWGRIIRGADGQVQAIREFKDASEEEKLITEVNPAFMCFNKEWLFANIDSLRANNKQQEYYLTDMVGLAFAQDLPVQTISIEPHEAMGINSLEELQIAAELVTNIFP
jgi:bifunctional N-acetylglucosamine-1-phosphate-uridyltransferase/glucosamine-1-phosphate-acetyltransferase GlmU-like protein